MYRVRKFCCLFLMKYFPKFHRKVLKNYWENTTKTHGDMSDKNFIFYAQELSKLFGDISGYKVLDYGGGGGEIATKLITSGVEIEVAEFTSSFQKMIEEKGLVFIEAMSLPNEKYDLIYANNCMFYVHPKNLKLEILRIMKALRPGGELWITDVPTVQKMHLLNKSWLGALFFKLTHIYDCQMGAFFVDEDRVRREFGAQIMSSWANYRSHFYIKKV